MLFLRIRLLLATLWAGSLWTTGYLVAPTLFATLPDRMLAGTIAGNLFRAQSWLTFICAGTLILLLMLGKRENVGRNHKILFATILGMLGCSLLLHFGLHPLITDLRNATDINGVMAADIKRQFGILHGLSSGFYLFESLLAVVLIVKIR